VAAFKLLKTKDMLLLSVTIAYTGKTVRDYVSDSLSILGCLCSSL